MTDPDLTPQTWGIATAAGRTIVTGITSFIDALGWVVACQELSPAEGPFSIVQE